MRLGRGREAEAEARGPRYRAVVGLDAPVLLARVADGGEGAADGALNAAPARAKFYEWRRRYGKLNEHNGKTPRDHWIEPWERQAIVDYFDAHPLEGYRRLTFMMLDDDVVAVSPATAYRVLRAAGRLDRRRHTRA